MRRYTPDCSNRSSCGGFFLGQSNCSIVFRVRYATLMFVFLNNFVMKRVSLPVYVNTANRCGLFGDGVLCVVFCVECIVSGDYAG